MESLDITFHYLVSKEERIELEDLCRDKVKLFVANSD